MKQPITFLVWTENSPGVLLRLTTLFTRRTINVESLTASATESPGISRFTIVVDTDPGVAATIGRQIERMIEVRRVFVFTEDHIVHREIALVRTKVESSRAQEIVDRHAGVLIVESNASGVLFQVVGTECEITAVLNEFGVDQISEFVRSGRIALTLTGNYDDDLSRSMHELRSTASEGPDF